MAPNPPSTPTAPWKDSNPPNPPSLSIPEAIGKPPNSDGGVIPIPSFPAHSGQPGFPQPPHDGFFVVVPFFAVSFVLVEVAAKPSFSPKPKLFPSNPGKVGNGEENPPNGVFIFPIIPAIGGGRKGYFIGDDVEEKDDEEDGSDAKCSAPISLRSIPAIFASSARDWALEWRNEIRRKQAHIHFVVADMMDSCQWQ